MTDPQWRSLRLTVLGCSTAAPHPASPASGYLVTWGDTSVLLDVGQGVAGRLADSVDPRSLAAVIVGHMHADHYIDLAALRYLYPWGERAATRLPVHLPPGGRDRVTALASAISERPGFFDTAFDIAEYDTETRLRIGAARGHASGAAGTTSRPTPWPSRRPTAGGSCTSVTPARTTPRWSSPVAPICCWSRPPCGPPTTTTRSAATSRSTRPSTWRAAPTSGSALIVHYDPDRHAEIAAKCEEAGPWIRPAYAGLTVALVQATEDEAVFAP